MTLLRVINLFIAIFFSALLYCQAPADSSIIQFSSTTYDFGTIYEADSFIDVKFTFTNKGNTAFKINKIYSPGLNSIKFPKDSIFTAKDNTLTFQFNPLGQSGIYNKKIYIFSNAINSPEILTFKGIIINDSYSSNFKHSIGGLAIRQSQLNYGYLFKGEDSLKYIPVYNNSDKPLRISFDSVPNFIEMKALFDSLNSYEKGLIKVKYKTNDCNDWDFIYKKIGVWVYSEDSIKGMLTITANMREDFSKLTKEEILNNPICYLPEEVFNFDTIQAGEKIIHNFVVKNTGRRNLIIRAVKPTCGCTAAMPKKTTIAPGKSTIIKVVFNSNEYIGLNKKGVTLITNDPVNYKQFLWINGFVAAKK